LTQQTAANKGPILTLLMLLLLAFLSVTQSTLHANIIIVSNSTTISTNISVTLTEDNTVNDTASSRQFLALDDFSSRVLGFCITAALGAFFGTYTALTRSKKPFRITLSVATLAAVLGVLAILIIVGPASQVVIPFLRSLASGSPQQALLLATTFIFCSLVMVFILYQSRKTKEPSKASGAIFAQQRITVNVRLPIARWGEKSTVSIHIKPTKLVMDLVDAGLKEVGVIANEGPWYLVTDKKVLGPENYHDSIQTSGIQNDQSVVLTDRPSIEAETLSGAKRAYIPQYAEPKILTPAELVSIARDWVRAQLSSLQLREWTDTVNEGDRMVQIRGVVIDQYVLTHEFDVRVSKEDGSILHGSNVK
jgi:hypothetical protein